MTHGESWAIIGRVGLGFKPLGLLGWDKDLSSGPQFLDLDLSAEIWALSLLIRP